MRNLAGIIDRSPTGTHEIILSNVMKTKKRDMMWFMTYRGPARGICFMVLETSEIKRKSTELKKNYSFFKKNTIPTIIAANAQDDSNPGVFVAIGDGPEAAPVTSAVWIGTDTSGTTVVCWAVVITGVVAIVVLSVVVLGTNVVTDVVGLVTYPFSLINGFWFWLSRLTWRLTVFPVWA